MKKIKFIKQDKEHFAYRGESDENIKQICRLKYRIYKGSETMSFDEACEKLGRRKILNAISRAAFHSSGSISDTDWGVESDLLSRR